MKKGKFLCLDQFPEDFHLPQELWELILPKLPAKTLMKFRCVCKTWCSFIDSPEFCALQSYNMFKNSGNSQLLLTTLRCRNMDHSVYVRRIDTFGKICSLARIPNSPLIFILQSCNGLLLMRNYEDDNVMLWNPRVEKRIFLPEGPGKHATCYVGFAPSSKDYKVLAVQYDASGIAVYSLNDHRWRVKMVPVDSKDVGLTCIDGRKTRIVFSGGAMYWVECDPYGPALTEHQSNRLFFFNFDSEEFGFVQLPDAVKESRFWFIFPLRESIAVFTMSSENRCIWAMNGEQGRWRLWLSASGEPNSDASTSLKHIYSNHGCPFSDILYVEESNMFLMVHESRERRKRNICEGLMSYNIINQKIQRFGKSTRGEISFDTYVECMALHRGLEGQYLESFPKTKRNA